MKPERFRNRTDAGPRLAENEQQGKTDSG